MHLHKLMLYDILFRNWECSLQNIFGKKIETTDSLAIKNEF